MSLTAKLNRNQSPKVRELVHSVNREMDRLHNEFSAGERAARDDLKYSISVPVDDPAWLESLLSELQKISFSWYQSQVKRG